MQTLRTSAWRKRGRKPQIVPAQPDPGLDVWEVWVRTKGNANGKLRIYPDDTNPFRFVNIADAAATLRSLENPTHGGALRLEGTLMTNRLTGVAALAEYYCEVCGTQTANHPSARPSRTTVTACRNCQWRELPWRQQK